MPGSRSRSRSPRRRSPSPRRRRSSSPRRRRSPPRRRPSPRRKSSPRRRSRSKSRSPRRFGRRSRSGSPGRPSPRRRRSPIRRRSSARRKSGSPRRSPGGPRSRERPLVREAESTVKEERSRAPVSGPAGDRGARARRESPLDRSPPPKRVKDLSPPGRGARDRSPSPYGGGPGGYSPLKDTDHRKSSFEQQPDYNEDKDYRRIGDFSESQQAKRYDQTEIILHSRITSYGDDPVNFVPEDIITIGIERNILGNQPADVMQSYNPDEVVITRKKDEGAKALYQRDEFLGAAEEEYVEKRVIKVQPQQQRRKSPEVIRRENFEVRRDRFARGDEDAAVSLSDRFSGAGHGDKDERFRSAHASSSITRGDRDERVVLERGASDIYGDEDLRLKLRGDRGREKTRGRFEADPKDLRHNLARKRTVKDEDVDARRRIVDKRKSEHEDLPDFSRRPGMIKHKGDSGELPDFSRRPGMMGKHKGEGGDLPDFSRRPDKGRFEEWREKPEMIPKGGSYYEHDNRGETGSDDFFSRRGGGRGRGRGRGRGTRGGGRGDGGGRGGYDRFRKRCDECDGEGCDECYVDTVYEDETSGRTIDDAIEIISDGSLPPNEDDWDFYDEILSDNDEFGSNLSGVDKSYGRGLSPIASDPSQDKYLEIESERERHRMSMLDVCYGCYKSIRHKFGDPDCPALLRNGDSMMTVFSSYTEALSNYHRAPFEAFGHNFSSVHQAWLWKKASSLGMQNFAGQLKDAASALEATKYCQELEDDAQWNEWDTRNQHIMKDLLRLKAEQYARFRVELKNTKTMIAAASTDKFWGTGMLASATIKTKPEYWSGKNVLGDMLVDLRQEIKAKGDSYQEKKPDRVYRKKSLSPQPAISRAVDKDVCIACRVKGHKPGGAACSAKNFGSEKITLLSMKDKSRLSPFYPGKLQYSSLTFPSAVQAWLWKKATLMDYVKLANMSLDAPSPAKAFKTAMDLNMTTKRRRKWDEWDSDHWHVLEEVMRMRYEQSASFRQELMNTKGTVIGCTDVVNKDWGTGLTAGESKFTLSSFWPRPNKLGKILMKLRDSPPVAEKEKEAVLTEVREPVLCGDCNQFYHKVGEKCPKVNDGIVPISIVTFTTNAISLGYWSPLEVFRHKFQSILHAFSWKKANALGYCQLARKILECKKNAELTEIINTAAEAKRKEWFEWDKGNLPMMKIIMSKAILNNARAAKTLKEVTGEIGFATTADSFWGTGLNRVDTQRIMPQYWPGENMYGKILQEFREGGAKCDICDKFGHPAFDRECRGYNSGVVQIIAFHDDLVDSKNYHPLSMHHLAPISVFNQRFTSVFHAFTWKKCVNLGMVRLATQIKNTIDFEGINKLIEDSNVCSDPALRWDDKEKDNTHFMKSILKGKAQQNKEFFGALRDTKNRKVAFAVKDCFWGTGLSRANTKETLPDYWPGKNMYGTLLLALRDEILVCKLCGKRGHVDGDSDCPAFNSDTKITLVLDSHSTLSNLHNTPVQVFSNRFPSAHQAWLYKKVTSLGLHRLAHQVISEESGDDAQQLVEETGASQDPSFDWQRWDVSHVGDMKSIIKTKAVQNENFRRALNNAEKMIALSIPDKFWGTGMNHELTARIMPEYWPGKNMMGTLLMEVREEVLKCGICHRTGHEENSRFCPALNTGEVDVHVFIHHQNVVSPFYSAPLEVYGHKFGAAHLAFLWKKCSDLRLNRLAQQVLTARHPGEIRMTVDTFIKSMMPDVKIRWERWDRENQEVMRHIIESKSEQTKHFNPDLQKTEGILAYPVDDKYWGTGLSTDLTKSILPEYWPGKNMLGQLLMEHRGVLSMCKACQKPGHELGSRTCPGLNSGQVPTTVISHHQHPLSNWFKHPLAIFEQKFLSAEQAWLWKKAAEMGHADVAEKILDVQTAGEAHRVIFEKGLEADLEWRKWDEAQYDLMKAVVRSKLEQCPPFRKRLKEVDSILACATTSKYWGTALNRVETRRTLPDYWPGQNMFGKLLTEIRQDIINKAIQ